MPGKILNDRNVDPNGPAPDLGESVETLYNPLVKRLAALRKAGHRSREWGCGRRGGDVGVRL